MQEQNRGLTNEHVKVILPLEKNHIRRMEVRCREPWESSLVLDLKQDVG